VEHWYRHRTTVENIFRDGKLGPALRHLPSGYPQVNMAWMWGALLAATMAAWLHQLTAATCRRGHPGRARRPRGQGHDRHPAPAADRRPRTADPARPATWCCGYRPGHYLLPEILSRLRQLPAPA